jgi:hypothetical protein
MKYVARTRLTRVPTKLRELKLTAEPLSYKRLYGAALDGRIPATQETNGRWSVGDADLPLIARLLCSDAEAA